MKRWGRALPCASPTSPRTERRSAALNRIKRALAALICLAVTCGCGGASTAPSELGVYRLSTAESGPLLALEPLPDAGANDGEALEAIAEALNSPASGDGMRSAFPEAVAVESAALDGDTANIEMSSAYLALGERERALCDAVCTLSFCLEDEVMRVNIFCRGSLRSEALTPDMYILADYGAGYCERPVKLCVPYGGGIAGKTALVEDDGTSSETQLVMNALLDFLKEGGGFFAIPEETELISVESENGLCTVNLSKEFFATEPENAADAELIILSIVRSLCALGSVERVTIQTEGRDIYSYGSYRTVWPVSEPAAVNQGGSQ